MFRIAAATIAVRGSCAIIVTREINFSLGSLSAARDYAARVVFIGGRNGFFFLRQ